MIPRTVSISLCALLASCGVLHEGDLAEVRIEPHDAVYPRSVPVEAEEAAAQESMPWFRSGPYVGASAGIAHTTASADDIDRDLAKRGYTTHSSIDESDFAWKLYGGYRFERPFAIELAAVDLGQIRGSVQVNTSDIDAFLSDLSDVYPVSAKGASLVGTWYALEAEHWELGLEAGLWRWEGDFKATAASGERITRKRDGVDPVFGAVCNVDLGRRWSLRAQVEHYLVDNDGETFASIGAQFDLR